MKFGSSLVAFWRRHLRWLSRTPDRRAYPRFQAEVPIVVSLVGDEAIASVHTLADGISETGLCLAGLRGLRVGDAISLELHLPNATEPIWLEAVVRHDAAHSGLQFTEITPTQRKLIRRYCRLQPPQKRHS